MISRCNECTNNKIVRVSENRREFRIENNSRYEINKVTVDDCYITSGLKCDYLFEIINTDIKEVFYVELKGSDIFHGIKQLESTIKYCKTIHNTITKTAYIVASRFPKSSTSSQKFKKEFKRIHSIQLFIDTNKKEVTV
jgi:hypothetical protein